MDKVLFDICIHSSYRRENKIVNIIELIYMLQLVENIKTKCKKKSTKLWNKFLKRQKQFLFFLGIRS